MKRILQALPIIVLLVSVGFFIGLTDIQKEKKVYPVLINQVKTGTVITNNEGHINYKNVNLFGSVGNRNNVNSFASKSVSLRIDKSALQSALASREKSITFTIPTGDAVPMQLELIEQKVFSDNSNVYKLEGNTKTKVDYTPGISYTGIIKGKEHSLASISIFNDFVMGVISDETGNYVLGSVMDGSNYTDNYIFYNDNDLKVLNKFKCSIDGNEDRFSRSAVNNQYNEQHAENNGDARLAVRIYFECDYRMYQDFQSNTTNVANFIQGMFAECATIYTNESIPTQVSDVGVWSTADPYINMSDNEQILTLFGQNKRDNFAGNFAQLLSTRTNTDGGGIAWINTMCVPYQADGSGRYSFCFIDPNFQGFPTYSWTVNVVTHELGHNFGSYHTHACHWPINQFTNSGAIDSCYTAEGNCFSSTRARTGTIMSYCHLTSGGINLALGFGPMPGDTIRLRYAQATCLTGITNSSETPIVYDLKQNYPNPFNPSTTIRFLVPEDAIVSLKVYNIAGVEVANLVNGSNYLPGFYDINFNTSIYNLPSGAYFYKLTASPVSGGNTFTQVKKMILIK